MNKLQIIKYCELKGINEVPQGKSVFNILEELGKPTDKEMIQVNQKVFEHYMAENEKLRTQITNLEKRIDDMQEDVELLNMLETFGVDNWEGYGEAQTELRKLNPEL